MTGTNEDDLMTRFFNEELSEDEQASLAKALKSSPSQRQRFWFLMQSESNLLRQASKRKLSEYRRPSPLMQESDTMARRPQGAPLLSSSRWIVAAVSTVAVVVALVFWGMQLGENQLSAAELFKRLEHASHRQIDRVYVLKRLVRRDGKTEQVQGELRCRGTESFVAVFPDVVIGGGTNRGFWCVPTSGPSFTMSRLSEIHDASSQLELGWLEVLMGEPEETVAINTTKVLALIRFHGYEIVREPNQSDTDGQEHEVLKCQLLHQATLPHVVRIRSQRQFEEIFRIDFEWGPTANPRTAELLSIELKSVGSLPAEEFQMDTYLRRQERREDAKSSDDQRAKN